MSGILCPILAPLPQIGRRRAHGRGRRPDGASWGRLEAQREATARRREQMVLTCRGCAGQFKPPPTGTNWPFYCSAACRPWMPAARLRAEPSKTGGHDAL